MIVEKKPKISPILIDLTGPDGNAFTLLGYASKLAKQMGLDRNKILQEMQSGDYENLISVFDSYFGSVVTIER